MIYGEVAPDPTATPQIGDTVRFQPVTIKLLDDDRTVFMEDAGAFNGVLLSLHFADDAEHLVHGSAVLVAPGIALTAKHVIEPYLEVLAAGHKHSMCIGIAQNGMQLWTVRKATLLDGQDLAILGLELNSAMPNDRTFRQATISTRLPRVGDRVQIVGYRATSASRTVEGKPGYSVEGSTLVSAGVVRERYPTASGRDRVMLPFPVIEVECASWGGMSGGPVFDEKGHLVGLLCSSFTVDEGEGVSYVSLLWPVLTTEFEGGWPAAAFPGKRTLLALAPKICPIEHPEAVRSVTDPATGSTATVYEPWE